MREGVGLDPKQGLAVEIFTPSSMVRSELKYSLDTGTNSERICS